MMRPHSKRERMRSSKSGAASAAGQTTTICLLALRSVLNVWKNSSASDLP